MFSAVGENINRGEHENREFFAELYYGFLGGSKLVLNNL
jgi:hypothetical protein